MWFNINYNKLAVLLLPTFFRKPRIIGFVIALVAPISWLYDQWLIKRNFDWYRLEHNGQRCKLRKVLNDNLDPSLRRIYIDEGTSFPRRYVYTRAENKSKFLGTFYIKSRDEYENTGVDFIVYVPQSIIDLAIYQLKYLLKYYKLAGKRYMIQPI